MVSVLPRLAFLILALAGVVSAQTLQNDEEIVRRAHDIQSAPEQVLGKEAAEQFRAPPKVSETQQRIIEQIAARAGSIVQGEMSAGETRAPERTGRVYRVFVSRSMGDAALKDLIALSAERKDLAVVFRGFAPGENFGTFQRNLQPLLGALEKDTVPPAVMIDPPKFTEAGVTAVPALAAYDDGKLVAVVQGVTSVEWLANQIQHGARGQLPRQGSVLEITEVDVLQLMLQRASDYDWEAAKSRSLKGFWKRQKFIALPRAIAPRTRLIDPTITVRETIKGPKGEIIALAGTRINPLDTVAFRQRVVIFDGMDRSQVESVKAFKQEGRRVTFITTQLDDDRGFEHLGELMAEIGAQVTLLTPEIAQRFGVERVPAVIEAKGNRFEVKEVPPTP